MKTGELKIKIPFWLLALAVIVATVGLAGMLYHTTHCHNYHNRCQICLLAASLYVLSVAGFVVFIGSMKAVRRDRIYSVVYFVPAEIPARSPPLFKPPLR